MYCPLCGSKLEIKDQPAPPEIDWELEGEALEAAMTAAEPIDREDCICPTGCFRQDYPLYLHHPFGGINSRAGDSWSLSWVE